MKYVIKDAFFLKSAGKLLLPGQYFDANEAQDVELQGFVSDGSCSVFGTPSPVPPVDVPPPPDVPPPAPEDITAVPGVGKRVLMKLHKEGITTVEQLRHFIKTNDAKELLGTSFDKISKQF